LRKRKLLLGCWGIEMVATGAHGFQIGGRGQEAEEPASRGMGWGGDTSSHSRERDGERTGRAVSRRRLQLVVGGLGAMLAVVACVHISGSGELSKGGLDISEARGGRRGATLPVMLQEKTTEQREADLKAEDEASCAEFNDFLHSNCMEQRVKERNAAKYWNANEVCVCVCVYVCIYVCMCVYLCVCVRVHVGVWVWVWVWV